MTTDPHYAFGQEEAVPLKGFDDDDEGDDDRKRAAHENKHHGNVLSYGSSSNLSSDNDPASESFRRMKQAQRQEEEDLAEALSTRLLAVEDDSDEEDRVLRQSLRLLGPDAFGDLEDDEDVLEMERPSSRRMSRSRSVVFRNMFDDVDLAVEEKRIQASRRVCTMISLAFTAVVVLIGALYVGVEFVGPPSQPVGPYALVERQAGEEFFNYYSFYEGPDSIGSNGYLNYVSRQYAEGRGFLNVTYEEDSLDLYNQQTRRDLEGAEERVEKKEEPFIYMGTAETPKGPRDSIRLEGTRRFDRGLFIIDVRHMPAGCGVWPAFWLTDEANWPVNGEIDIIEGVNYQTEAKTALHSTKGCSMSDIPLGVMTGGWDTAQGIPDKDTGIPDMTLRYAQNCFVYDPHQWLNQGCVAVDKEGDTIGQPVNEKGGGVYALEWDPVNRHIRTWVFTPHENLPSNLVDAIRTASYPTEERIMPDPDMWPIPYGFFSIGEGTDCPAYHYRHMRLVFNTAFCGSVAGNRFQLDCPKIAQEFKTCNEYIKSNPAEMAEAYWKIRGVFVYQREWRRTWLR